MACSSASDWFRGVANTKPAEAFTSPVSGTSPKSPNVNPSTKKGGKEGELPPAVVDEVLDWLKDEVDSTWLDDCVGDVAETQHETLELVDAGKKCTSVIGANGDYRSGKAREAVAYLLKSSMAATKLKAKKTLPGSVSNNSTALPSTVVSQAASACPTHRSEKSEEPLESWRTTLPSEMEPSQPGQCGSMTPSGLSEAHSPCEVQVNAAPQSSAVETPAREKQSEAAADINETGATTEAVQDTWGFAAFAKSFESAAFAKSFESLRLPTVTSWSAAADRCGNLQIGQREVVDHGYAAPEPPAILSKPVEESPNEDEWATAHFAELENVAHSLTAANESGALKCTANSDDECRSYVNSVLTSALFPPPVPPLVFPTSGSKHECALAVADTIPSASMQSDSDRSTSNMEEFCPKGHDQRWHAWRCGICDKRGCGLRFGCAECLAANICVACRKTYETSSVVHAEAKADVAEVSKKHLRELPRPPMPAEVSSGIEAANKCGSSSMKEVAPARAVDAAPKSCNGAAPRASSSRGGREKGSASKSVLSVQTTGTSSAAQLLGGIAQQQATRPEKGSASKSVLSVQTMGTSSAAQLLGGIAQQQGTRPRISSRTPAGASKSMVGASHAGESKSVVGAGSTQRGSSKGQRLGGSVLSVKHTSSSAAAGLLGPLLEQKAKR
jgi:hypothetical protein